jgi:hypothetical protein
MTPAAIVAGLAAKVLGLPPGAAAPVAKVLSGIADAVVSAPDPLRAAQRAAAAVASELAADKAIDAALSARKGARKG